ncbi:uncharacterized protein PgNI_04523 [Pyricularia grisea]|uniref:Uncharacterized protein n=1 Tax=Pyricularia grisea TaxID=148305 RepID=A0A6P8B9R5_PYRGI|nr:uncharacterized protein PgNI_04523 [Pyricularia grisea]TLD12546.1 hypothetical protein PgNI_04523 [Pyricularia grisea]
MPPNSLVEWMIGQNVSTTKQKKISTFREVVRLQVATDDESGEDSILLTYPRTHQSGKTLAATPPGKKVRFDQKPALKDSSSPISLSSSSSSGSSEEKPKKVATQTICEISDSEEDSEPHPTCSCADCRVGRRRARRLARLNKKLQESSSDASSDTAEASEPVPEPKKDNPLPKKNEAKKKAGKNKSPKKPAPEPAPIVSEASDTPGETTEGTQTEGDTDNEAPAVTPPPAPQEEKKEPAGKKTKNGGGNVGKGKQEKKVKNTDEKVSDNKEKNSDNKEKEALIETASQVFIKSQTTDKPLQLPPYSQESNIRPPNLLMPVKAQVLQVEHAIETPDDPRPNAFVDNQYGVLRVYHGPAYGNALGNLYPRRSWSGKDLPLGAPHPMHNPYIHGFGQHSQGQGHGGAVPDGQGPHSMMPPGWYAIPGGDGHLMPAINQWGMPNTGYQPPPPDVPIPNPPAATAQPPETGGISLKFDSHGRPITSGSARGSNKDQGWGTNIAPPTPTAGPGSHRSQQGHGSNKDPWKTNGWASNMPWGDGASGENAKEASNQGKGSNRDNAWGGNTGAPQAWGSAHGGSNRSNRQNGNNGGQWATDANNQTGTKGWGGGGSNVSKKESALPGWPTHSPKCPPPQNPWASSNSGPNNEGSAGANGGWNDPKSKTTGDWGGGGGASTNNWNAWGTGSQTNNIGWNEPPKNTSERASNGGWNAQPSGNSNVAWGGGGSQRNDPAPDAPVDGPSDARPQGSHPANQDVGPNDWNNPGPGDSTNWGKRGGGANSNWSYNNVGGAPNDEGGGWGRSGSTKGTPPRPPSIPANQLQSAPNPPQDDTTKPPSDSGSGAGNWDTRSRHSGGGGKQVNDGDKGDGAERMPCTWPTPLPSAHPDGGWPSDGSGNDKITDKEVPEAFFGPVGPSNVCDQPATSDNNVGGAPNAGWANAPSDNQNNNWTGGGGGGNWNSSNVGGAVSTGGDGGYGPAGNAGPISEIPPWGDATAAQSTRPEPQQQKPNNIW